jgi:hypothetical protein
MNTNRLIKYLIITLAIAALLMPGSLTALAEKGTNPGILPPDAHPQGNTLEGWSTKLFQAIFTTPLPDNPFYGAPNNNHCVYQLDGHMALLWANVFATEPYSCSVPPGTMLMIGVAGVFADDQEPTPCIGVDMGECVSGLYDIGGMTNLSGSIDGQALTNLDQYLVSFNGTYTAPEMDVFGYAPATPVQWAGKGVNIITTPLSVGEHTLHFHSEFPGFGITIDNTLVITVEP